MSVYINLKDLKVYRVSLELSELAWEIYNKLNWQMKKVIGDQFLTSATSVGANIAEGYGRFHFLDKTKFYYNARGSLFEAEHWTYLLRKRQLISEQEFNRLVNIFKNLMPGLNKLILETKNQR